MDHSMHGGHQAGHGGHQAGQAEGRARYPQEVAGLPHVGATEELRLADGDTLDLRIAPVRKAIGHATVRMYAYNGSIPGPTLRVRRRSTITVNVRNDTDLQQTVHWHGLRLENRYDGVPHETQEPIGVGGRFTYQLQFPDEGLYWYHPHIREDYGQEMGLYGNIVVEPDDPAYWPPVDRELVLTIDDLLLEAGQMPAFSPAGANYAAMGRYGNVMLVGGSTNPRFEAGLGEVVRLYLTNTANARPFNLTLPGARLKLIGGDSGRVEREEWVEAVPLAPSERAVVDARFEQQGTVPLVHRGPRTTHTLAVFEVAGSGAVAPRPAFETLRTFPALEEERARLGPDLERPPDKHLSFTGEMVTGGHAMEHGAMEHGATEHGAMDHDATDHGGDPGHDEDPAADGIEWEDEMPAMNALADHTNMHWRITDLATSAVNHEIFWTLAVGDRVKIRLANPADSGHPMQHPFHVHGAGRFLVLSRDGVVEANLAWKDTVLVPAGQTVDILLDVSNPGRWMAHCHIAEHTESGMMFSFDVLRSPSETLLPT